MTVVDNPLPPGNNFIGLTMTFYDDYSNTAKQYTTTCNSRVDAGTNQHAEPLPEAADEQAVQTIGLVTGTKVRVLEDPNDLTRGDWLETASFYDDRARVVQTQGDNDKGGQDTTITLHNFTNQVITTYLAHADPAATANGNTHVKTNMELDAAGRVLQVYTTINDQDSTKRLIASNSYDQLGQLQQKQLGQTTDGSFLETQDYSYNIRGWLKGINRDYADSDNTRGANDRWFGLDLSYDWGFGTNQLNGNIAGERWRSKGDGHQRAYGFGYDDANRLLFADFNQYGTGWDKTSGLDFSSTMGDGSDPATAYDENGNIKAMKQMAWQLGNTSGSQPIDELSYNYYPNSNKLQNVIDGANDPSTTLGDFRTSALSPYATGKTAAALDYHYDVNGNLTRDLNKDIGSLTTDGIVYNHLNLPWQITFRSATGTKGTITYIYDATGNKLKKTTIDSAGNLETVTTYIGAFQYQSHQALGSTSIPADTLQFLGQPEGRVRLKTDTTGGQAVSSWKYDYFLKDHLGNTRMVLTDEQETDQYPAATMEVGDSATENLYYTGLDETRVALPAGYPTDTTTKPNNYVAQLYSPDGNPVIGPGIVLKVMAGDRFSIRTSSWYQLNGTSPGTVVNPLTDIVSSMIAGVAHIPGESATAANLSGSPALSPNVLNFLTDTGTTTIDDSKPHAFLNWILFDNQFNYVAASSGYQQVGADGVLTPMTLMNLPVTSSGFLYIYTSNTTPNIAVLFDNLQVTHTRGPLLEEDHYYPGGLTMAGISDKALKSNYAENKYRFDKGAELQNKEFADGSGLDMYETHLRELDPQFGRWWQIDSKPLEMVSPYSVIVDDPILYSDPVGDTTWVYNQNGNSLGVVPDRLKNQVHYIKTDGDPGQQINTKGLSRKELNALGKSFREKSIAFIGSKTISDMHKIDALSEKTNKEVVFVGTVGKDKEIRLSALPGNGDATNKSPLEKKINDSYPSAGEQSGLFLFGHTHFSNGFTYSDPNPQSTLGFPSPNDATGGDYGNFLYRNNDGSQKGPSPALLVTKYGVTVYGSKQDYSNNSYLLYQSLKQ